MPRKIFATAICLVLLLSLIGCKKKYHLNKNNPVTISLWHNYGGQMKNTMDELIDEFNTTIGKEKGIIINVTSISGSSTLSEKLNMAANSDPGAPEMPDITTLYPKTALTLANKELLVNLDTYFDKKELSAYVDEFLEEGRLGDGGLYVFPTAKSTEVLFVNKTLFDRFSKDTGITMETLKTFEGIVYASYKYYEWSDGKMFFMPDSLFNMVQVGFKQLSDEFIVNENLNLQSETFKRIWDTYYSPAVSGSVAIFDGYSSDLVKTGDIVCALGSSAGVLFYPSVVSYSDNTTEEVEYEILPYPVFDGGKRIAIQRGGGMSVIKSTPVKEYASSIFLKWFTSPVQNMKFVATTGYFPVTEEAYGEIMNVEIANVKNNSIKKILSTAIDMQKEYDFYIPPIFHDFDKLEKEYEERLKKAVKDSKNAETLNKQKVFEEFIDWK
jgi:multiple sugar transport system substrate-binding protein